MQKHDTQSSENVVYIVGVGPGDVGYIVEYGKRIIEESDVLIGGKRNLQTFQHLKSEKVIIGTDLSYVVEYIMSNYRQKSLCVLSSGDTGIFSITDFLKNKLKGVTFKIIPGISSLQYLCSKLGISWNDMRIVSVHGRKVDNLLKVVMENKKTALFTGGEMLPRDVCKFLLNKNVNAKVTVGERLSYKDERIVVGTLKEISQYGFDSLSLMIVENVCHYEESNICVTDEGNMYLTGKGNECINDKRNVCSTDKGNECLIDKSNVCLADKSNVCLTNKSNLCSIDDNDLCPNYERNRWKYQTPGVIDHLFLRGEVPMTKEEVRAISISKLRLKKDSIVVDIGAGTGSVSVECALISSMGQVFAVERNSVAVDLIRENASLFCVENIKVIEGEAPFVLNKLPAPDRVFIGGTGGHMDEILGWVANNEKESIVVINAISPETVYEAVKSLEKYDFKGVEVLNMGVSKGFKVGDRHIMKAMNPIYIISGKKEGMS